MTEQTRQPAPATPPSLPVCVRPHGGDGPEEATRLFNINSRGATLLLARAPELGQLLHLQISTPGRPPAPGRGQLCALVWAVTPPDQKLAAGAGGGLHRVSVVFVGEEIPAGGEDAPRYAYLAEEDGRFRLQRLPADAPRPAGRRRRRRRHARIRIAVEVIIELLGPDGAAAAREQTVTENLSRGGAAVLASLAAPRQLVRVTSERHNVSLIAIVRARRTGPDNLTRLHLEFIDGQWPLEQLQ